RALAKGEAPVIRSDGRPERDYLYVEDAVDAYLAVARSLDEAPLRGRAWNAGWGSPLAVREIVDRLIAVAGFDVLPEVQGDGTPHGEIDRQYLDSSAIRAELGWEPRVALDEGLRRSYDWYARLVG
ncbi:MAG TPA: GDP-mannose 4,6-dehydratase, partial [Thermoleophilaceae bacterium]|nr:GDP-mannose 4,6-dehydratase [Thermoleophilaceae bacterium]